MTRLSGGTRLGHYELVERLGAGGMGEVWRARDTRLRRDVAVKVLPDELACGGEGLKRFEQEARALAALNHPNVAQVYGIDQAGETCFIAMELVPGEDLSQRLRRGPLRPERVIDVGRQIAAGLEAAHEAGVVHRDLKPANVRRTPAGEIKVLDFGLAKALPDSEVPVNDSVLTTQRGRLLGTPAYMAPEQIRGAPADRRVDVWAFGCLLYVALTGQRPFQGETVSDVLSAVLEREPDLDALPPATPPRLRALVERCLRKDPRQRLRDIGDARLELEEQQASSDEGAAPAGAGPLASWTFAVGLALVAGVLSGAFAVDLMAGAPEPREVTGRYSIPLPRGTFLETPSGMAPPLAASPDGREVVFVAKDPDGVRRLYRRRADEGATRALPGTEGAEFAIYAPGGDELLVVGRGGGDLQRFDLVQETAREVPIDGIGVRGACWTPGDELLLGLFDQGLAVVPVEGGTPTLLARPAGDEEHHAWPQLLPDGDTVLFTAVMKAGHREPRLLSCATGEVERLGLVGATARYHPGGYLLYVRSDELLAARFDLAARRVVGEPRVLRTGVHSSILGTPFFALSEDGDLLVHEPARPPSPGPGLVWVDREGGVEPLAASGKGYEFPAISPDGRRVAVAIHEPTGHDIWTVDTGRVSPEVLASGANEALVRRGGNDLEPKWFPSGDRLVYASAADGDLHWLPLTADAEPRTLLEREGFQLPLGWTPAGRLLFAEQSQERRFDLLELDVDTGQVRALATTEFNEFSGGVSPDGRWLAYVSDETGRPEVYLRRYPELGPKLRVTAGGAVEPVWSPQGDELFYRDGLGVYAVEIRPDSRDPIGETTRLFEGDFLPGIGARPYYDVDADAERFVMVESGPKLTLGRIDVTLGLDRELEQLFAGRP